MAQSSRPVWNLPNALTLLRLVLGPVCVILVLSGHDMAALVVFLFAGATDIADGYAARKLGQVTDFGKLMDPLADKLLTLSVLLSLTLRGIFPLPALLVLLLKELLMVLGGLLLLRRKKVVSSKPIGKAAQASLVAALTLGFLHGWFDGAGFPAHLILLWASVALSLAALVFYALTNWFRDGTAAARQPDRPTA